MDDRLVITLLRHGVTDDNKRERYIGWTDSPLSKSSVESLLLLKHEFVEPELVFSSDLRRCVETAEILFPCIDEKIPELREINFGDWEGRTFCDLQDDAYYQRWLAQPFMIQPPNGESFAAFTERVETGWTQVKQKIIDNQSRHTVIVTHGGVIRYLLTKYGPPKNPFWGWHLKHGNGYECVWSSFNDLKEGNRCISLQAVPSMEKAHG